jgi:hypothetical protein
MSKIRQGLLKLKIALFTPLTVILGLGLGLILFVVVLTLTPSEFDSEEINSQKHKALLNPEYPVEPIKRIETTRNSSQSLDYSKPYNKNNRNFLNQKTLLSNQEIQEKLNEFSDYHTSIAELMETSNSSSTAFPNSLIETIHWAEIERKKTANTLADLIFELQGEKKQEELSGAIWGYNHQGKRELTPLIKITHDLNSSITSNAENLDNQESISNYSFRVGVFDSGSVRVTHRELVSRAIQIDSPASLSEHATRVAGVIAAKGIASIARAITSNISIDCYDWNNDISKLIAGGATLPNQLNKIPISNHSYNYSAGWYQSSGVYIYLGHWTMGQYNRDVEEMDALAYSMPYLTMIRSAGNDRTENPTAGQLVRLNFWSTQTTPYDPAIHPLGDGLYKNGFDTISYSASAKNVISVGAVNDGVTSGARDLAKATLTTYTSWGPTDDGRIKPDLVANGASLYTCSAGSDTSYANLSGTSAAAPVVSSLAALLTQYWINNAPEGTTAMRSDTLKALLIHGADDLGNTGPDYKFGWGLANGRASLQVLKDHFANPTNPLIIKDTISSNRPEDTKALQYEWDQTSPQIKITICWVDPKGPATSQDDSRDPRLVNDIDIKIIDPNGVEHYPFVMPFVSELTLASKNYPATTGVNSTDNVEMIIVDTPTIGKYKILVSIKNNPNLPQDYTLITTGVHKQTPNTEDPYQQWAKSMFGENWESIPNTSPLDDFDQDGLNNWAEFHLNTDPKNKLSSISSKITSIKLDGGTKTITLRVSPVPQAQPDAGTMRVVSTTDLSTYTWEGPSIDIPSQNNTPHYDITITSDVDQLFFRVQYTPPPID